MVETNFVSPSSLLVTGCTILSQNALVGVGYLVTTETGRVDLQTRRAARVASPAFQFLVRSAKGEIRILLVIEC